MVPSLIFLLILSLLVYSERIFDAFHTTKPQGTGMGLAISRSILEYHGGRIRATRNQGAGATFHFTLPIEAEARA